MRYVRDVPAGDDEALAGERAHVIAHLSAVADADDDPTTHADDVRVWVERHPDDPDQLRIVGELDAEPDAPYLQAGHDPFAGVDPELLAAFPEAVTRGQA